MVSGRFVAVRRCMCERSFMVYPFLMHPACDLTHGVDYDYEYWDLLRKS